MKTTFLCPDYALFDNLALGDIPGDPAEPKPFRLFAVGENSLTRNGPYRRDGACPPLAVVSLSLIPPVLYFMNSSS